jgi:hypothetical protein
MKYIFIIAPPRSGTNLLRDLLNAHPKIETWPCDEINLVWKYKNINKTDELKTSDIKNSNRKYILKFFEKLYKKTKSPYILEKTCANSVRLNFVNKLFPNSFFIFIERNQADILNSILIKYKKTPDFKYIYRKFIYVPNIYKFRYLLGILDFFIKIHLLKKKEPSTWGPKIDLPQKIKNKNFRIRILYMIKYCIFKIKKDKKNIISENKITIKYENLVENPKNTLFKILKKIDQELLNDLDKIDTSKVTKIKISKGTKYKNLIKKFNFNLN